MILPSKVGSYSASQQIPYFHKTWRLITIFTKARVKWRWRQQGPLKC